MGRSSELPNPISLLTAQNHVSEGIVLLLVKTDWKTYSRNIGSSVINYKDQNRMNFKLIPGVGTHNILDLTALKKCSHQ